MRESNRRMEWVGEATPIGDNTNINEKESPLELNTHDKT